MVHRPVINPLSHTSQGPQSLNKKQDDNGNRRKETKSLSGRLGSRIVLFRCKDQIKESRLDRMEVVKDENVLEFLFS